MVTINWKLPYTGYLSWMTTPKSVFHVTFKLEKG